MSAVITLILCVPKKSDKLLHYTKYITTIVCEMVYIPLGLCGVIITVSVGKTHSS